MADEAKPRTVDQYIEAAPPATRAKLQEMRACLRKAAPDAEETLKWGIPAFSTKRILFTYAAFKRHIGFYPTPAAIQAFAGELSQYETSAGTIRFPLDRPLPVSLIDRIASYRVQDVVENDARWM
ncbi:iron chaperone [Nitratireductor sp. GCM10026969]|uniref:iron chaperone n=1 Tax=Nitratireductor sp. GCM10026969 TaxID=3252645 RepID=UPI00360F0121